MYSIIMETTEVLLFIEHRDVFQYVYYEKRIGGTYCFRQKLEDKAINAQQHRHKLVPKI